MDFKKLTQSIDWASYSNPCFKDQNEIGSVLLDICHVDESIQMEAMQKIWNLTAHQGNVGTSCETTMKCLMMVIEGLPDLVPKLDLGNEIKFR